ncbi:hypothetical protein [Kribbella qitaiheensis]|uniref:hypothetical protein n=1 Tax=Kribbella qitaiheensis TaxID=1544730 RepID=UPI0019D54F95|nr:hypothetical protein [Kribbella qitaiheensis]
MTKQGSFKRAVRERARETGQRYTQALADLEQINRSPFARTRPFEHFDLKTHLETRYGIQISSLANSVVGSAALTEPPPAQRQ